jgi:hypothetical protein
MSIDLDDVNARVSINDIFLAQSIMTRKAFTEPGPVVQAPPTSQTGGTKTISCTNICTKNFLCTNTYARTCTNMYATYLDVYTRKS